MFLSFPLAYFWNVVWSNSVILKIMEGSSLGLNLKFYCIFSSNIFLAFGPSKIQSLLLWLLLLSAILLSPSLLFSEFWKLCAMYNWDYSTNWTAPNYSKKWIHNSKSYLSKYIHYFIIIWNRLESWLIIYQNSYLVLFKFWKNFLVKIFWH